MGDPVPAAGSRVSAESCRGTFQICSNPGVWVSVNKTVRVAGGSGQLTEGPGGGREADVSPQTSTACVVAAHAHVLLSTKKTR